MWKEYSKSYIKNNKTASISIMIAVLISSVFISAICSMFYNMWTDNIQRIIADEGAWQGRIIGTLTEEQIQAIEQSEPVEKIFLQPHSQGRDNTLTIVFHNPRNIYKDFPQIMKQLRLDEREDISIEYHHKLLSEYFIYSEEEQKDPPLLLTFYIFVMVMVCLSLIMIIYNAFGITMSSRLHQLGILQSVGATPKQIRTALLQETCLLSFMPIFLGTIAGIAIDYLFIQFGNSISVIIQKQDTVFTYSPIVFCITIISCLITVFLASWKAARKLSSLSPLEAIRNHTETPTGKIKPSRMLSALFGIEGELAGKSIHSRRKAYRTANLSLTLSFLMLGFFLNFMTLSDISTRHSYFERYKDSWDLMITVKNKDTNQEQILEQLRTIPEITECTMYQKAYAYTFMEHEMLSDPLKSLGGLEALKDSGITSENGRYQIQVPIIIMDDKSYQTYCRQIGVGDSIVAEPSSITVNRIWDNLHSDFRDRQYVPFILEQQEYSLELFTTQNASSGTESIPVKILGYTNQIPQLREQYNYFSLLQIMSATSYQAMDNMMEEPELYYRIFASSDQEIDRIETEIIAIMDMQKSDYQIENRKDEEAYNTLARKGLNTIMEVFCGLLAVIGIANVFANTLGNLSQRKREFARYLSIGLTPGGMKKILLMEALMVSLKPILVIVPLNILFVIFAVYAKYDEFINMMPIMPLVVMAMLVFVSVGGAYYLSGRSILRANIVDALKDDTLI